MPEIKILTVVKFLEKCLRESGVSVSRIVMFGSQARGTASEDSDIDIVIVSEDFQGADIFKRIEMTRDAEIKTIK